MPINKNKFKLSTDALYHCCDLSGLKFNSSDELENLDEIIGQERALQAIDFGINVAHKGYNLFVLGSEGIGKTALIKKLLRKKYQNIDNSPQKLAYDWCYVNNFEYQQHPQFLKLPAGMAKPLSESMEKLLKIISELISTAFQSEEYVQKVQEIENKINQRCEDELKELVEQARKNDVAIIRTPSGYTLSSLVDGKIVDLQHFKQLPKKERKSRNKKIEKYQDKLHEILGQMPILEQKAREELNELDKEIATQLVEQAMEHLFKDFLEQKAVNQFLADVKEDIINNLDEFYEEDINNTDNKHTKRKHISKTANFHRYLVNVLVDNSEQKGLPIIFEDNPTYSNLLGRIEYLSTYSSKEKEDSSSDNSLGLGNLLTAFTLIKPGSLHKANHGFLLLDAEKLLINPYAWEGLKRALKSSMLSIEPLDELHGFARFITLEPEPIPLNIKIIMIGDREIYHLLKSNDAEFDKLFKVNVDFAEEFERIDCNITRYARLIADIQRQEKTAPLSRNAIERIIEHASRCVEHREKLSLHIGDLRDLMLESQYYFMQGQNKQSMITAQEVNDALYARKYRDNQFQEKLYEDILNNIILIDTQGSKVGQINGLSVLQIGEYAFGQPSRITATVRIGDGNIVDIEREVALGGEIHSKGVMILTAYLNHVYAKKAPLSLDATLAFEQNYGLIDGDSASIAELCVLISAITEIPIQQNIAVTGSINQLGEVQAIGGVNEKIEGFFAICQARGLNGKQGVIIPAGNVENLMLDDAVIEACKHKSFHIYAVTHVEQAMSILMDKPIGNRLKNGAFSKNSINQCVLESLRNYSLLKHKDDGEKVTKDIGNEG